MRNETGRIFKAGRPNLVLASMLAATMAITGFAAARAETSSEAPRILDVAVQTVTAQAGDPFAYCARKGTVDKPASGFTASTIPPALEPYLRPALGLSADAKLPPDSVYWRCMDGAVYVCAVGANLPCGTKADRSLRNAGAEAYCRDNPSADLAPAYAAGHDTIYAWRCAAGHAVRGKPTATLDRRGYRTDIWHRVTRR